MRRFLPFTGPRSSRQVRPIEVYPIQLLRPIAFPLPPGRRVKRTLSVGTSFARQATIGADQSGEAEDERSAPVLADCRLTDKKICLVRGTRRLQSVVLISVIQTRFTFQNSGPVNSNFPARLLRYAVGIWNWPR